MGVLASVLVASQVATAAEPATADVVSPLMRAEELFNKGLVHVGAGDWDRALDLFNESARAAPTWQSAKNAAFCLDKLARDDRALEAYEGVLASFSAQLPEDQRVQVEVAVATLKQRLASIEITANVGARIEVDGKPRGELRQGVPVLIRLPADTHRVQILKKGFVSFDRTLDFAAGSHLVVYAGLEQEPPPPPPPPRPNEFPTAFAGYAIARSLGSTAEGDINSLFHPPVSGFVGGIRGGYRLPSGIAVELTVGYLSALSVFSRSVPTMNAAAAENSSGSDYELAHALRVNGVFFGLGTSYRAAFNDRVGLLLRSTLGLLNARSTDPVVEKNHHSDCENNGDVCAAVRGRGQSLQSTSALIMPEIGFDARWRGLRAGLSLGLVVFMSDGPSFAGREAGVDPAKCLSSDPGSIACAPNVPLWKTDPLNKLKNDDLAYGAFATLWVPQITLGYSF